MGKFFRLLYGYGFFFFTSLNKEIQFFFAENILNLKLNTKMLENVMANMLVVKICLSCWKFYFKFKEAHTENVFLTKSFSFADNYFNIWFLADEKIHILSMFFSKFINSFSLKTFTFYFTVPISVLTEQTFGCYLVIWIKPKSTYPTIIARNEYVNSITL